MKKQIIYLSIFLPIIIAACSSDDLPIDKLADKNIEILFSVPSYHLNYTSTRATGRATESGTEQEEEITNLYLYLFDESGQNAIKYEVGAASFTGGKWSTEEKKVTLDLTQSKVGKRQVYVVANYKAEMKPALAGVNSIAALQGVLHTKETPWSPGMDTPILMSGYYTSEKGNVYDFTESPKLESVRLIRAIAKLELHILLKDEHQSVPVTSPEANYKYKLHNFDKSTYVLKSGNKVEQLVSTSDWVAWDSSGEVTGYTTTTPEGKVTNLTLITYLNERDEQDPKAASTSVEIALPYDDGGFLPPPEFGVGDRYILNLPSNIERNTIYRYEIEI